MSIHSMVKGAVTNYLREDSPPPTRLSERRRLDNDDVTGFMEAAQERDDPIWSEIYDLLKELEQTQPLRVSALRRELRWLRHHAHRRGLPWGRQKGKPWQVRRH